MKRDWDLIREILVKLEDLDAGETIRCSDFPGREGEAAYNAELLIEANLIDGRTAKAMNAPPDFFAMRLTWHGHEFLDAIRNDTIWSKTKAAFAASMAAMTFELVKAVAVEKAKELLSVRE